MTAVQHSRPLAESGTVLGDAQRLSCHIRRATYPVDVAHSCEVGAAISLIPAVAGG